MKLFVALLAVILVSPAAAAAQPALQNVTEFTVNGLKVVAKQRPASQTVAAGLFIKGGTRNISAANAGIEALTLNLATEASANFPREQLRRELSRTATGLSFGINYDYSVLTLGTTRQHFDRAWELFVDAALHPSLTPDDFALVKQRRLSSLSDDQDTPDSLLALLTAGAAYTGHVYQNDPRGTASSLERITLADVRAFHRQILQTSRLLLVVVGDIDTADLRRKVTAAFSNVPVGDYRAAPPPPLVFAAATLAVTARDLPTNYVQGTYAAPPLTSPDIYPMRVATAILRNRVFEEVRAKRNLSYAPDASLNEQGANTGGIYVTAVDANQAVQVMLGEIAKLQAGNISSGEITGTTQAFLTSHYTDQETNAAQAGELARYELIGGGWQNSAILLDRLRDVTPQDVQRVARTHMKHLQFVVIGNPTQIDRQTFLREPGR